MVRFLLLLALISPLDAYAQLRVGVIDSGLDIHDPRFTDVLCRDGNHKDFTGHGLADVDGHGTFIVGLIKKYAKKANYCLIIYKFYHTERSNPTNSFIESLNQAFSDGVSAINISGGGKTFQHDEYIAIRKHPEVKIFAAAGNEGSDLATTPFFPAAYPLSNITTVGNGTSESNRAPTSNYGRRVDQWEVGQDVVSTYPLWKCDVFNRSKSGDCMFKLSGTSMSTAIAVGKWLGRFK